MQYLLSITAFVIFFTSSNLSIAAVSCHAHEYETVCKEDSSCEWDGKNSKCKTKEASTGCTSHSEFYCEANGERVSVEPHGAQVRNERRVSSKARWPLQRLGPRGRNKEINLGPI
jgi:hypothetical protein